VRTCVIFNPVAKGEKARRFLRHLADIEAECSVMQTAGAEDARRLAAEAVGQGFETIVAAGGDGTLNEVINGIADAPGGFERARLGVLPLGTVNVFARELGLPRRFELAWQTIQRGRETRIDLPRVEYGGQGKAGGRCFAQLAGAGLDARAIELVHWPLKKKIGPLAYVIAGIHALLHRSPTITVTAGQRRAAGQLVLIGNGRLYGGQFQIFPGADLRDGLLEVCVFRRVNFLTLARCGPALLLRGRLPPKVTDNFQAASLALTSSGPALLEVDGELIGQLPATFTLQPAGLRVIVP
jgi:YegS/Rv2252/BmrU family lipid kinase